MNLWHLRSQYDKSWAGAKVANKQKNWNDEMHII